MDVLDALYRKSEEPKKKKPKKQKSDASEILDALYRKSEEPKKKKPKKQKSDASDIEAAIEELRQQSAERVSAYSEPPAPSGGSVAEVMDSGSGSLTPADVIRPYYGDQFEGEVLAAQKANEKDGVLRSDSYSRLFDPVPVEREEYSGFYMVPHDRSISPRVSVPNKESKAIQKQNEQFYRDMLQPFDEDGTKRDIRDKRRAQRFFTANSYSPEDRIGSAEDTLEHELGHHYARPNSSYTKADTPFSQALEGSSAFGAHMAKPSETVQAMGRLQREVFKNTGSRIKNREQFLEMVDNPPEYLSPEGKRILYFSKRLKEHRMGPKEVDYDRRMLDWDINRPIKGAKRAMERDEKRKEDDRKALDMIIEGLPSVVENTKRSRRFFA
jgi:hypothetical protein